jgi:hypothetical protein
MSAALDNGLEVTALHNHFFFGRPAIFFMHIGGHGTTETLATGVRKALDAAKGAVTTCERWVRRPRNRLSAVRSIRRR